MGAGGQAGPHPRRLVLFALSQPICRPGRLLGLELRADISAADVDEARGIVEAFIFRRSYSLKPVDGPGPVEFTDAAIDDHLLGFEAGLRTAQLALVRAHADAVLDILNDGRVTFTPAQRADPRYHQLFRHPKLAKIAAVRRREGVTAGLPVFPVKAYTGR